MYSFWSVVDVSLFLSMLFECERVRVRVRMRVWVCECVSVPVRYVLCVHARQYVQNCSACAPPPRIKQ